MPATNKTTNYNLPQWVGTDKPSWVGDVNPALATVDGKLFETATKATTASTDAAAAKTAAEQAAASAAVAQTAATNAVSLLTALGITNATTAAAFKALVDNAVPKYDITAAYFDAKK